jgi:GTP-binding protein HflX
MYGMVCEKGRFMPEELIGALAGATFATNKEIAAIINRHGRVVSVSVGDDHAVELVEKGARRDERRVSGLRCIHTHPDGNPELSDIDISALSNMRLDAMAALAIGSGGRVVGACAAIRPIGGDIELLGPYAIREKPRRGARPESAAADVGQRPGAAEDGERQGIAEDGEQQGTPEDGERQGAAIGAGQPGAAIGEAQACAAGDVAQPGAAIDEGQPGAATDGAQPGAAIGGARLDPPAPAHGFMWVDSQEALLEALDAILPMFRRLDQMHGESFYDSAAAAREKAILVAGIDDDMEELEQLARTAGAEVLARMAYRDRDSGAAYRIGKGKLEELNALMQNKDANLIIINDELSGVQLRNLEDAAGARVVDRTMLILDIFAARARSREGKLQVELAQLNYSLSRLGGLGTGLSRLGGGIGTRGPGEKKLDTDRRHIRRRIHFIEEELRKTEARRNIARRAGRSELMPVVALAGYTNAGKTTLFNRLCSADALAEDKLFATLDPTARKLDLPSGGAAIMVDTVGFIQKLPHELVDAFKATLEESASADVIVHVVDASNENMPAQIETVRQILGSIGAGGKKTLIAFNKMDKLDKPDRLDKPDKPGKMGDAGGLGEMDKPGEADDPGKAGRTGEVGDAGCVSNADNSGIASCTGEAGEADDLGITGIAGCTGEAGDADVPGIAGKPGKMGKMDKPGYAGDALERAALEYAALERAQPAAQAADVRHCAISAATGDGIDALLSELSGMINEDRVRLDVSIPYEDGGMNAFLHENASILKREYTESGVALSLLLDRVYAGRLKKYIV